jgi:hypothetical protein
MTSKVFPLLALCLLSSGCALSGHHCVDDGGCAHVSHLGSRLACGSGCGEIYWDEWLSDPPACEDPCDDCGHYVGPRSRILSPLAWCNLWGQRTSPCGDCGTCDSCTSCDAPSCGDCGGCSDCTSRGLEIHQVYGDQGGHHEYEIPNQIEFKNAAPLKAAPLKAAPPKPPAPPLKDAKHRVRRGKSLISLTSAKLSGRTHKTSSAKRSTGRVE